MQRRPSSTPTPLYFAAYGDACFIAHLPYFFIMPDIDGLVLPDGSLAGAGQGGGICIIRHGIGGEERIAVAIITIRPDMKATPAILYPAYYRLPGGQAQSKHRL